MAIKKGAFEVYAQERQLPNKDINSKQLKSPFFENLDNDSQTVHKRFTDIEEATLEHQEKQEALSFNHEQNNGSQTVHTNTEKTEIYPVGLITKNGSQTVYKRFTDIEEATLEHQDKQEALSLNYV